MKGADPWKETVSESPHSEAGESVPSAHEAKREDDSLLNAFAKELAKDYPALYVARDRASDGRDGFFIKRYRNTGDRSRDDYRKELSGDEVVLFEDKKAIEAWREKNAPIAELLGDLIDTQEKQLSH